MAHIIGIFSDTHGNLQALDSILRYFDSVPVDEIIHLGDSINMGGDSKACTERLLATPNCTTLLGNHDFDFVHNRAFHSPMSHVSEAHKKQVFASLGEQLRQKVAQFPVIVYRQHGGKRFAFCHYALKNPIGDCGYMFLPLENDPTAEKFDKMFASLEADVVFFGHKHEPCDIMGNKMYVDVGSVGCHELPFARGIVLTFNDDGTYSYARNFIPYDRSATKAAVVEGVPDGKFIFDFYFDRIIKD
jgi:predicted phosphodiesterase